MEIKMMSRQTKVRKEDGKMEKKGHAGVIVT